jgi:hypothetical protein
MSDKLASIMEKQRSVDAQIVDCLKNTEQDTRLLMSSLSALDLPPEDQKRVDRIARDLLDLQTLMQQTIDECVTPRLAQYARMLEHASLAHQRRNVKRVPADVSSTR